MRQFVQRGARRVVQGGSFLVFLAACGSAPDPGASSASAAVVTEHRFVEPSTALASLRLPIGADCSAHGPASCASNLCVHASLARHGGYVCSVSCVGSETCPAGWRCAQTYPGPDAAFCVPVNGSRGR